MGQLFWQASCELNNVWLFVRSQHLKASKYVASSSGRHWGLEKKGGQYWGRTKKRFWRDSIFSCNSRLRESFSVCRVKIVSLRKCIQQTGPTDWKHFWKCFGNSTAEIHRNSCLLEGRSGLSFLLLRANVVRLCRFRKIAHDWALLYQKLKYPCNPLPSAHHC